MPGLSGSVLVHIAPVALVELAVVVFLAQRLGTTRKDHIAMLALCVAGAVALICVGPIVTLAGKV